MKRLFDPLFCTYGGLWAGIHLGRHLGHPIPLLNGYLTDFLTVPAIAHLTVTVTRRLIFPTVPYQYPLSYLLFMAAYASLLFEWLLPQYSPAYTADPLDAVAYFAGCFFYYFFHRKPPAARRAVTGTPQE